MDDFKITELKIGDLENASAFFYEKLREIVEEVNKLSYNLNFQKQYWKGKLYNEVLTLWNETTSGSLYQYFVSYDEDVVSLFQELAEQYKGLIQDDVGDVTISANTSYYEDIVVKIELTPDEPTTFDQVNIQALKSTLRIELKDGIKTKIMELPNIVRQQFTSNSTSLDLFFEKISTATEEFAGWVDDSLEELISLWEQKQSQIVSIEENNLKDIRGRITE